MAADGAVYQRPLLYAELSSTDNTASKQETNETWRFFMGQPVKGPIRPVARRAITLSLRRWIRSTANTRAER